MLFRSERNDGKAREWWEKAAKQGFPPAQTGMGLLYTYGKNGVPRDDKKALEWFKKAAAQNEAFAQYNIAIAYGLGKGVPRDFDKQREWLEKAAAQHFAPAEKMLKELDALEKAHGKK